MKTYATPGSKPTLAGTSRSRVATRDGAAGFGMGNPTDSFEREADQIAGEVVSGGRSMLRWSLQTMLLETSLQRKCGCSRSRSSDGECEECKARSVDGVADEEEITTPAPATESAPAKEPSPAPGMVGQSRGAQAMDSPASSCPSKTQVEKLKDLTPDGLKAGYATGYGVLATMRVLPDATNWNGTRIAESLTLDPSGTCPKGLTSQPCTAGPPFTVGDGTKGFSVLPAQPGQQDRFYDFHRTRSNISLLHDATRNPSGMSSCTLICKQSYSCGGTVIGNYTLTRTFTKGTYQGKDVTLVSVTKT